MAPKYPRTFHLPWSPGGTSDDRRLTAVGNLLGPEVLVTEKMDGSNVCMEREACFARSHAAAPSHPSFAAFKAMHASVQHLIPGGLQVFGEWLYAKHSIEYQNLGSYFQVFGVRNLNRGLWLSWAEVEMWAEELGVPTVPVLFRGVVTTEKELRALTEGLSAQLSACGGEREGVVVRVSGDFSDSDFGISVAKRVRKDHVQTDDHWKTQAIVRNGLG